MARKNIVYAYGPTRTKICQLTLSDFPADAGNFEGRSAVVNRTDEHASIDFVTQSGEERISLTTHAMHIHGFGGNNLASHVDFRNTWDSYCGSLGAALEDTNLEDVSIVVTKEVGNERDWVVGTLMRHLRGIPTLRQVTIACIDHSHVTSFSFTLETIGSLRNLETLFIVDLQSMSPDTTTALAATLQNPNAFPALTRLSLPERQAVDVCPPDLVEPWTQLLEAIRTKDTLQHVRLTNAGWIDRSTMAKLQTFPVIHSVIREFGLMLDPAPQRGPGVDLRDLLIPPAGSPDDPTSGLSKWISAMQLLIEDEEHFGAFHFFFSKIPPNEYIDNPNLTEILAVVPHRPFMVTLFRYF